MPIPWPKILPVVTVPVGGYDFTINFTDQSDYDKPIEFTIPAGDYFMSFDNQDDDLMYVFVNQLQAAMIAGSVDGYPYAYKTQSNRVGIFLESTNAPFKIDISECDEGLVEILGLDFDTDSDLTSADGSFVLTRQHAYGWYANEDGLLESLYFEDSNLPHVIQMVNDFTGAVTTQYLGNKSINQLVLQFLSLTKTYSGGKRYTEDPLYPYPRNEGLECWWYEAIRGKRFRVYCDAYVDSDGSNEPDIPARAIECLRTSSDTTDTITDSTKSWATDPQRFTGRILFRPNFRGNEIPQQFYIASNTSNTITVANAHPDGKDLGDDPANKYYVMDHTYKTYVLDLDEMKKFEPKEIPRLNRFGIEIPLLRYV